MVSFFDFVRNQGIEVPKGNISGEWFYKNGLLMVVAY